MPNDIQYHIGDGVQTKLHGEGIVLGSHIDQNKVLTTYHVYFEAKDLLRYVYAKAMTLIAPATDDSIAVAQAILLESSKTEPQLGRFCIGDIVETPIGRMILLDNGHVKKDNSEYYHAAHLSNNNLHYINHNDIFYVHERATDTTRKQAKQILFDAVLSPAFSA